MDEGLQSAQQLGDEVRSQIDSTLMRVTETVDQASRDLLRNGSEDEDHLLMNIRNVMFSDPNFVESGVAFAPFAYDPQIRLYGFSYVVDPDGMHLRDLDVLEDYTNQSAVWYHQSMQGNPGWLEPEYDKTRGKMLVTYAAPVRDPTDPGEPVAVVFATYSVSSFEWLLDDMDLGSNGYGFLLSPDQRFIVHYNQDYLDHRWSLGDFLDRLGDTAVADAVFAALTDPGRTVRLRDPDSGQDARVFFLPVSEAAWTLGIVLNDSDLRLPSSIERIELLRIVLLLCLSIVLLTIPVSGIRRGSTRGFWILSNVFTACCIVSYVTALNLIIVRPTEDLEESLIITNQNVLNGFITDQRHRTLDQREEVPLFVPTGMYIHSIGFDNPIGGLVVNGYLWQRYTLGIHDHIERGFVIPGSFFFEMEEPVTTRNGNTDLVRWGFKAILSQDFDFSRYPFGRENIQIHLRHKQFTKNVILTPDLASYKIVNPAARPGLEAELPMQGWNIERSFFAYRFEDYSTSFGATGYAGLTDFPELFFTIEVSKQIVGAIISHALPLIVVITLLFALLLMASFVKPGKLEVIEAIAACSGFFLVIVFSHIGMRESFAIKDTIYLEYFYYATYVLILFTVANYVIVATAQTNQKRASGAGDTEASLLVRLIRYRDNLIAKVLYWPISQFALLVLTLLAFY